MPVLLRTLGRWGHFVGARISTLSTFAPLCFNPVKWIRSHPSLAPERMVCSPTGPWLHEPSIEYSSGRLPFLAGGLRCSPHGGPQNLVNSPLPQVPVKHHGSIGAGLGGGGAGGGEGLGGGEGVQLLHENLASTSSAVPQVALPSLTVMPTVQLTPMVSSSGLACFLRFHFCEPASHLPLSVSPVGPVTCTSSTWAPVKLICVQPTLSPESTVRWPLLPWLPEPMTE